MRKILFILLLAPFALKSQTVNTFRDSTWFKRGVRFDSTLVFSKGAGVGKVWTSNANGTGSWQTFSSAGVTQGALDDSISDVRAIRKVDTIYKNLDSIVFKIKGVRYAVLDSTGGGVQTLSISGDTLSISGGNSVTLPIGLFPNGYNFIDTDYVLQASDEGKLIIALAETPIHITVPTGSDVFTNKIIGIAMISSGDFEIQPGVAVTPLHQTNDGLGIGDLKSETVICQTAAGDGINGLSVLSTSVINDNGSYKTMLRYLYDKSQDAIPLSGTEVGKSVTGDIEMSDYKKIYNNSGVANSSSELSFDDGNFFIRQSDIITNDVAQLQIQSISPETRIVVKTTGVNGSGLEGYADYSANYTDFTYTQKIYVDQRISDTANVLRGLIPDVSNFITSSTLTDSLEKKTNKLISFNTYTTSDTLRLSDADKVIEMNVGTANNLVIPTNTAYAFPVGTQITVIQIGAGQTTLVPASGVTVRSASSKVKLSGQYSGATLIKKNTNEWYLFGDITN